MILVDTSVWIDFLRRGNDQLRRHLEETEVLTHPLVIGELHVGNIENRKEFLSLIQNLPQVPESSHEEVRFFIEQQRLFGTGIGYADAHILSSAVMAKVPLWTLDKRLAHLAARL